MSHTKTHIKNFCLIEKVIFLKRCIDFSVILPSLDCKKIDLDLILIQQKRILLKQITQINSQINYFLKTIWIKLNEREKAYCWNIRNWKKKQYNKKFNWLRAKQKIRRIELHKNNSMKTKNKNKYDSERYKKRQTYKKNSNLINSAKENVLNKSSIKLKDDHLILLNHGLNFVPTPAWTIETEKREFKYVVEHVRRAQWKEYYENKDSEDEEHTQIPEKLKIPKLSLPPQTEISKDMKNYTNLVYRKMEDLKDKVNYNYKFRNNLNKKMKIALKELKMLLKQNKIVISKSDKDGKVIILDYKDYTFIVTKKLENFNKIITNTSIENYINKIKSEAETNVEKLHKENIINDEILFHTIGKRKNKNDNLTKISGPNAKFFKNTKPGHIYLIFKTHKLNPELLKTVNIKEIPTREIWAVGNSFLSRTTAMLQYIIKDLAIAYCSKEIDEYCRDSSHYLETLHKWKQSKHEEPIQIVTADVKNLYPSLQRNLIKISLEETLKTCTSYTDEQMKIIIKSIMFCLENNYVSFQKELYKNNVGIPTGENFSVSLANIALHYITLRINNLKNSLIYKRFIDDIIFICPINETKKIKNQLSNQFNTYGLTLNFKEISTQTEGAEIEFLDVLHKINKKEKKGFKTTNYIKPTATFAKFLNGNSYHPPHVFRGIILGEANRLKKLNENKIDYTNAIKKLETKCKTSNFKNSIINKTFIEINHSKTKIKRNDKTRKQTDRISWATSFKQLITFDKKEFSKNTKILRLTYKRPKTLRDLLRNNNQCEEKINHEKGTFECGKCSLCGNFGKNKISMVTKGSNFKEIKLKQNLNCKDYGIYCATCIQCAENYIGQTVTSFSKRWNAHRTTWKNNIKNNRFEIKDQFALIIHYKKMHKEKIPDKIENAYKIQFLEKPKKQNLDFAEHWWLKKNKSKNKY